jgi:SNF2 family DNA or RNA helicase
LDLNTLEEEIETSNSNPPINTAKRTAVTAARAARDLENARSRVWRTIAVTQIPKAARSVLANSAIRINNLKRLAKLLEREAVVLRRGSACLNVGLLGSLSVNPSGLRSGAAGELGAKAKRLMRESLLFWKMNEKLEKEAQKRAHLEALERQRQIDEMRERQRQERKLNFLLSQTELFTHFVSKKLASAPPAPESEGNDGAVQPVVAPVVKAVEDINFDDEEECVAQARAYAQDAVAKHATNVQQFTRNVRPPSILACDLKEYQLKGLEWLISLYEQGINGILADEMGLGKTVQSIALLSWLAENNDMWGPYLIVTPASTLHNWQQELAKFVPTFKVIPYWGTPTDRAVLRQFWARKRQVYTKDSPAHVVVTSYQYATQDLKHFTSVEWEYMILDEAQAIKSSSSMRWNALLQVKSRNRLLLTGTPVQNSMKELWALLHFIMPTLFDSHVEFNEWFSRDIESAAANKKQMNAEQVQRLHMILQPFMLRRVKRDVQSELGEKTEVNVSCALTKKQQVLYRMLKQKLSLRDILESMRAGGVDASSRAAAMASARRKRRAAAAKMISSGEAAPDDDELVRDLGDAEDDAANNNALMNVVMQLRKVCNHPDLIERLETVSPFVFSPPAPPFSSMSATITGAEDPFILPRARPAILSVFPRNLSGLIRDISAMHTRSRDYHFRFDLSLPHQFTDYSTHHIEQLRNMTCLERYYFHEALRGRYPRSQYDIQSIGSDLVEQRIRRDDSKFLDLVDNWYPPSLRFVQPLAVAIPPLHWRYVNGAPGNTVTSAYHALDDPDSDDDDDQSKVSTTWFRKHLSISSETKNVVLKTPSMHSLISLIPKMPSTIRVPNMQSIVSASGKLLALEALLPKLRAEGHRCLVYFQMTKMMDLMEDYLTWRQYSYLRLDGSTDLADRRDLVSDWQTRDDIFIFLLSTRAGGVGINLTAADTVMYVH